MADPHEIAALRDFNRFYTSRLGLTRDGLHSTTHPLAEARVLYELGANGTHRDDRAARRARRSTPASSAGCSTRLEDQGLIDARALAARRPPPTGAADRGRRARRSRTLDARSGEEVGALLDALPDPSGPLDAMRRLRRRDRAAQRARSSIRGPSPATSAGSSNATASSTPASTAGTRASSGSSRSIAADFDPRTDRAWIAERRRRARGRRPLRPRRRRHRQAPHAAGRAAARAASASARGSSTRCIKHARRSGYATLDAVDQRHPARRPPHLRARRASRSTTRRRTTRSATTSIEQTWSPYPQGMDRDALRALQAPLKSRYKDDPSQGADHAEGDGHARRGRLLLGRHRPRDRRGRPASRDRRRRHAAVLRRHAARGARRLRGRDARRGRTALGIAVNEGRVHAEGDLDFRGTLGVDREAPVGFPTSA